MEINGRKTVLEDGDNEPIQPQKKSSFWDLAVAHIKDNSLRFWGQRVANMGMAAYNNWLTGHGFDEYEEAKDFKVTQEDVVGYEDFPQLLTARTPTELTQFKEIADDIKLQRKVKAEHGFVANFAASFADPVNYISAGVGGRIASGAFKLLGVTKKVGTVTKAATASAAAGATDVGIRSIGYEQDPQQYVIGATTAGLLGAATGAAPAIWQACKKTDKAKLQACAQALEKDLQTPMSVEETVPAPGQSLLQEAIEETKDVQIKSAFGAEKIAPFSPETALMRSSFETAKAFGAKAVSFSGKLVDEQGMPVAAGRSVEMTTQSNRAVTFHHYLEQTQNCFKDWLKESKDYGWAHTTFTNFKTFGLWKGKPWDQFCDEWQAQMLKDDGNCSAPIARMVSLYKNYTNQLTDRAWKAGVFNESLETYKTTLKQEQTNLLGKATRNLFEQARLNEITAKFETNDFTLDDIFHIKDPIYFNRIYAKRLLEKQGYEFEAALVQGYRAEGSKATDAELWQSAARSRDKIIGLLNGQHRDTHQHRRFELSREIDIPSYYIKDYLVKDPVELFSSLLNTYEPDIQLMKSFGTLNKDVILKELEAEAASKKQAVQYENKAVRKIDKEFEVMSKNISAIWDRIREDPVRKQDELSTVIRNVRNLNVARSMGKTVFAALYDSFGTTLHIGFGNALKSTFKLVKGGDLFKRKSDVDLLIRCIDATEPHRLTDLSETMTKGVSDKFAKALTKASLIPWVDERLRIIDGYAATETIVKHCLKTAEGKSVSKYATERVRLYGISEKDEIKIATAFKAFGEKTKGGIYKLNSERWDETTREILGAAIKKAQNLGVLTPTKGATPLFLDNQYLSLVFQFKRCLFAATSKCALPLLQDVRAGYVHNACTALAFASACSYMKEFARDWLDNRERSVEDRVESALASIDAWAFGAYIYDTAEKMKKASANPYLGTYDASLYLLGTGGSFLRDSVGSGMALAHMATGVQPSRAEVHAVRRMIPFNNLIFWSSVIDRIEEAYSPKKKKRHWYD